MYAMSALRTQSSRFPHGRSGRGEVSTGRTSSSQGNAGTSPARPKKPHLLTAALDLRLGKRDVITAAISAAAREEEQTAVKKRRKAGRDRRHNLCSVACKQFSPK